MKISRIERIPVDAGFNARPERHMSRELWNWSISEVIRLETDDGIVGWGETLPHYTWGRVSEQAIDKALGRNPFELLWGPGNPLMISSGSVAAILYLHPRSLTSYQ